MGLQKQLYKNLPY